MRKHILVFFLSLCFILSFTFIANIINPYKLEVTSYIQKHNHIDNNEESKENIETVEDEIDNNKSQEETSETVSLSVPLIKKQLTINYSKGVVIKPEYLVIHETANTRAGADANAHYRYWSTNPDANASTHFVVDSNEIYQMLELNQMGWHVGDNKGYSDITNRNSIGIEVAVNSDGDFSKARQNAIELTIKIMKELNMNINQLKRHHDASGKYCPTNMLNHDELWIDFVSQVKKALEK